MREAFLVKKDLGILLVDELDFGNLLLLEHLHQFALVDILLRGHRAPAKEVDTDEHSKQNGIDPIQIKPTFAVRFLIGLVRLSRLIGVSSPFSLLIIHVKY